MSERLRHQHRPGASRFPRRECLLSLTAHDVYGSVSGEAATVRASSSSGHQAHSSLHVPVRRHTLFTPWLPFPFSLMAAPT